MPSLPLVIFFSSFPDHTMPMWQQGQALQTRGVGKPHSFMIRPPFGFHKSLYIPPCGLHELIKLGRVLPPVVWLRGGGGRGGRFALIITLSPIDMCRLCSPGVSGQGFGQETGESVLLNPPPGLFARILGCVGVDGAGMEEYSF